MPDELSADQIDATANHSAWNGGMGVSPEQAADIERAAGHNIAIAGGTLPDLATEAAHEGYNSVPVEDRGKPQPAPAPDETPAQPVSEATTANLEQSETDDEGKTKAETIQGGDIHENVPAGMTNPPALGPVVVHRPITRDNLHDHAEAVADAVYGLEKRLAQLGLAPGEEEPEDKDFADLPEGEREARTQQAGLYVGNAVLSQPDTNDFRTLALWAIARALRPKLVIRHRGVTPEV